MASCISRRARSRLVTSDQIRSNMLLPSGHTLLTAAIEEELGEVVGYVIDSGLATTSKKRQHSPPLIQAIRKGNKEIIKMLVDADIDLNQKDMMGFTALHVACLHKDSASVQLLLEHGANPDADSDGKLLSPPLRLSIDNDDLESVSLLLECGADVNIMDRWGNTPIMRACIHASPQIMSRLIASGANLDTSNRNGHHILSMAITHGNCDVVQRMLQRRPFEKTVLVNALVAAIHADCRRCFQLLLDEDIQLDEKAWPDHKEVSFPPLVYALTQGGWHGPGIDRTALLTSRDSLYSLPAMLDMKRAWFVRCLIQQGVSVASVWDHAFDRCSFRSMNEDHAPAFLLVIRAYSFHDKPPVVLNLLMRQLGLAGLDNVLIRFCMAGYTPSLDDCQLLRNCSRGDTEQLMATLDQFRTQPRSLQNLSVLALRRRLNDNILYRSKLGGFPWRTRAMISLLEEDDTYWDDTDMTDSTPAP